MSEPTALAPAPADAPAGSLEALLRKCHRPELLPLARAMGIRADGLGLGSLAAAIARTLRRRGANDVENLLFRRGEGPDYDRLVHALARRRGVQPGDDTEATERALAEWWIQTQWAVMTDDQRATLWRQLRLQPPAPPAADAAVARIRGADGPPIGTFAVTTAAMTAARFVPVAGCFVLYWLARPRDEVLVPAVLEVARLRQTVRHRVTVGFVGSPSSGKDAAIRAIFGIAGKVDPVAGSTTEVEITRLDGATALYVVNTPGLGDVVQRVTDEAKQVLDHIDVYLYLINAQGGVQAREKADFAMCRAARRPVLAVLNKVDTLKPADRQRLVDDCRAKLGLGEDEPLFAAAFDPLPQLSEAPIGLDETRDWIAAQLAAAGKAPDELPWVGAPAASVRTADAPGAG